LSDRVRLGWDAPIPATWVLVAALVAVHVVTGVVEWHVGRAGLVGCLFAERGVWFRIAVGGKYLSLVRDEPWRLVTSVLLHTSAAHLAVNAVALAALGRVLEPWFGGLRVWAWFVAGGVIGSAVSALAGVRISDGASGGAFALLGAAVVVGWRIRDRLEPDERRLVGPILGGFLALDLVLSFVLPFIDAAGHLGGLAAGCVAGALAPVGGAPPWVGRPSVRLVEAAGVGAFALICLGGWASLAR
jgi:membrane associated rhomboid family serine protease